MPKQFKFFINNQLNFQCRLQSEQCTAIKPNGLQCRNRTVIGTNICWTHLLHRDHLRILDTPHGKGLFAKNPRKAPNAVIFSRAQRIISYGGQICFIFYFFLRSWRVILIGLFTIIGIVVFHISYICRIP